MEAGDATGLRPPPGADEVHPPATADPEARSGGAGRRRWPLLALPAALVVVLVAVLLATGSGGPTIHLRPFSLPREGAGGVVAGDPVTYPPTGAERHRPVVLVFFASWCVDCRTDLPVVAGVARAEARSGDRAVFEGIDGNDTATAGWDFAHRRGVTFPLADDEDEVVANQLGLTGLPSTAVVAADGDVVARFTGVVSAAALEAAIAEVAPTHAATTG